MYRWKEHVGPGEDYDAGYRTRSELEPWLESDQVARIGAMLDYDTRARIDTEVEQEILDATRFAEQSPFPEPTELYTNVFAGQ